ncbi:hypothetical protein WICPIJ_010117 [Wickerhamomyces pijperi]|uniref:Uncharacterized protein n=1 Tax=Wickerhamomyces pijperi TaxID=599730 RepID=A0A9P8PGZ6_WICPI|nr:hypothetical protein WICPIJ_010117 [Wickerhamomyces pijperi]
MFTALTKQFTTASTRLTTVRYNQTKAEIKVVNNMISALRETSSINAKSTTASIDSLDLGSKKRNSASRALLADSLLSAHHEDPRVKGLELPLTGPIAGRMVKIHNFDLNTAFKKLRGVISANNIKGEKMAQRFYKKPGKVLEEKQIRRKKRVFNEGVRRLMQVVVEAKRRGY